MISMKGAVWKQGLCRSIAYLGIGLLLLSFSPPPSQSPPFSIELVVPISNPNGIREIAMDRYPQIHVLLKNTSQQDQRLWKDWNTWGYFNLSLEWQAAGQTFPITRLSPKAWDGDFPDFWLLHPGETVILVVDMSTGLWKGFPDLYGETLSATLTATYVNKPDELASAFDVWVGKLETRPIQVVFK